MRVVAFIISFFMFFTGGFIYLLLLLSAKTPKRIKTLPEVL